jgi:hypothetical protein
MSTPGYTADATLYRTTSHYRLVGTLNQEGGAIHPSAQRAAFDCSTCGDTWCFDPNYCICIDEWCNHCICSGADF